MDSQKIENLLNLALDASAEERIKSEMLNVGYDAGTQEWELIVRYHGTEENLIRKLTEVVDGLNDELRDESGNAVQFEADFLFGGYVILTVPQAVVSILPGLEEIEYIEKPKRLYFSVNQGKQASCIMPVQTEAQYGRLRGRGVLVAVIDSGIDYTHPDFRNADGTTRIVELWDQTNTVYTQEQINAALVAAGNMTSTQVSAGQRQAAYRYVPSRDISGHGTAVAGIAVGNGRASDGRYSGVAPESELLVVKLGSPRRDSFPRTTELMRALSYCIQRALELRRPIAINLSFGNTYGSHIGNSLLETYIDLIAGIGRNVICIGAGNEGASGGHVGGMLGEIAEAELAVAAGEPTLSVQLWKAYEDIFAVGITGPDGSRVQLPEDITGVWRYTLGRTELLVYLGEPTPYAASQEIFIDLIPAGSFQTIDAGVWSFRIIPQRIITGIFRFYLPSEVTLQRGTRFMTPSPDFTLTIPSTSGSAITVAAYNSIYNSYADFSGRGSADQSIALGYFKPELAAPGVDIMSTDTSGGYAQYTGTSFAAPFVTGSAALLMEWGIIQGNDPYLYGEKVKAYLIKGARQLPGMETPNVMTGWGALCLRDSLSI